MDGQERTVDEQDDTLTRLLRLFHIIHDATDALLEIALVFGSRHQGAHVEREHPTDQAGRDISVDDPLGETFDDSSLSDSRLTDENGVVLGSSTEDPNA